MVASIFTSTYKKQIKKRKWWAAVLSHFSTMQKSTCDICILNEKATEVVGLKVGAVLGLTLGATLGIVEGLSVGVSVGTILGTALGVIVGRILYSICQ